MFSQKATPAQPVLPALQHTVSGCQTLHADSRKIQPGDVFIACQGEYADGRNYIADAIANGASFVYWDDDGAFQWQPEWRVPNQGISDLSQRAQPENHRRNRHQRQNLHHPMACPSD